MNRGILLSCLLYSLIWFAVAEDLKNSLEAQEDLKNKTLAISYVLEHDLEVTENDDNSTFNDAQERLQSMTAFNEINVSSDLKVASESQTSASNNVPSRIAETTIVVTKKVSDNESHQGSTETDISSKASTVPDKTKTSTVPDKTNTSRGIPPVTTQTSDPSNSEEEKVVLGTSKTVMPLPKTVFQKSIEWMGDVYTLSILIPTTAGVVFACTIISMIAICSCMRRRCRRRRLRRKALPDSVKNMTKSDRARLLAESTDDEF